jgi:hypothetical protein
MENDKKTTKNDEKHSKSDEKSQKKLPIFPTNPAEFFSISALFSSIFRETRSNFAEISSKSGCVSGCDTGTGCGTGTGSGTGCGTGTGWVAVAVGGW